MMLRMKDEEALDRALEELAGRKAQMTAAEFDELVADRARELAGHLPLYRLKRGKRLDHYETFALLRGIDAMLSDFYHVAVFGDARIVAPDVIEVMFRLTDRMDIGYTLSVRHPLKTAEDFNKIGTAAAVQAYDRLNPSYVIQLKNAKPLS